jgi:hypothetical protein
MTEQKQNTAMTKEEAEALRDIGLILIFCLVLFLGTIALFASLVG